MGLHPHVKPVELKQMKCCAFIELNNISHYQHFDSFGEIYDSRKPYHARECLGSFVKDYFSGRFHENQRVPPCLVFTQASGNYGHDLKTYIEEHGLGKVNVLPTVENWTGKLVTMFVWEVERTGFKKWGVDNGFMEGPKAKKDILGANPA